LHSYLWESLYGVAQENVCVIAIEDHLDVQEHFSLVQERVDFSALKIGLSISKTIYFIEDCPFSFIILLMDDISFINFNK
jgi:hypothetical protein